MKNAMRSNLTTPVSNLGTWRPIEDLPKNPTEAVLAWPSHGGWADEIVITSVAAIKAHECFRYWQPLPSIKGLRR